MNSLKIVWQDINTESHITSIVPDNPSGHIVKRVPNTSVAQFISFVSYEQAVDYANKNSIDVDNIKQSFNLPGRFQIKIKLTN